MDGIIKLSDVLLHSEKFEWSDALFLIKDEKLTLDSKCAVLDPDDVEDDADEDPKYAKENNLKYALTMQDTQSIAENAKEQKSDCTVEDLFKAFLYYYNNDAFIDFYS